jgi:branched-chain amino acid transport system substrate-binding protein
MRKHSAVLCLGVAAICAAFAATRVAHAQDKVIKIGGLFAMSGPGSYFGVQDKQGIELAVEQLNKSGVNGYRFEIQYEDSVCSPLPATQAAKRILEQYKPHVVLGEECSDATLAIMPLIARARPRSRSPIPATRGRFALCPMR